MPMKRKNFLIMAIVSTIVLVFIGMLIHSHWLSRRNASALTFVITMQDGSKECILNTGFLESQFGEGWRQQALYYRIRGWVGDGKRSVIDGDFTPLYSTCLGLAMCFPDAPAVPQREVEVELYSRGTRRGCLFKVNMGKGQLTMLRSGTAEHVKEIVRSSGALAIRPLSGPGAKIP
jgi:hypothetical protein